LEDELADGADAADLRARLDAQLDRIEQRIETAVNTADAAAVSAEDNKNMVRYQMPFFDRAFFLPRQFAKHFSQTLPQLFVQRPSTTECGL